MIVAGEVSWTLRQEVSQVLQDGQDCANSACRWRSPGDWPSGRIGDSLEESPSIFESQPGYGVHTAKFPAMCPKPDGPR